jgi:hypothetical protein
MLSHDVAIVVGDVVTQSHCLSGIHATKRIAEQGYEAASAAAAASVGIVTSSAAYKAPCDVPPLAEQLQPEADRYSNVAQPVRVCDDGGAVSDAGEAQPTSLYDHIDLVFVSPQQVSQLGATPVSPAIHSWHQQQMSKQRHSMQRLTLDQMKSGSVVEEAYLAM